MRILPVINKGSAADQFDISRQGMTFAYSLDPGKSQGVRGETAEYEFSCDDPVKVQIIEEFLKKLTGDDVSLRVPIKIKISGPAFPVPESESADDQPGGQGSLSHQLDILM